MTTPDPSVPYPSFFLIGGKKCGTTALFQQLQAHPDIAFPRKEMHYFSFGYERQGPKKEAIVSTEDEYRALFAPLAGTAVLADASPSYLVIPETAERLRRAVPDARIAMVLRHPVDRLWSDYHHELATTRETHADLREALDHEGEVGMQDYRWRSRYGIHLERYLSTFPRDQIEVLLYDDFVADEDAVVGSLYRFIGVADFVAPPSVQSQRSGVVRSRFANTLIRRSAPVRRMGQAVLPEALYRRVAYRLYNANIKAPESMDPELRRELCADFEPDVQAVEAVLGRSLDAWRE